MCVCVVCALHLLHLATGGIMPALANHEAVLIVKMFCCIESVRFSENYLFVMNKFSVFLYRY